MRPDGGVRFVEMREKGTLSSTDCTSTEQWRSNEGATSSGAEGLWQGIAGEAAVTRAEL